MHINTQRYNGEGVNDRKKSFNIFLENDRKKIIIFFPFYPKTAEKMPPMSKNSRKFSTVSEKKTVEKYFNFFPCCFPEKKIWLNDRKKL